MLSDIGREMLSFQEKLAEEYKYQPIQYNLLLGDVRQKYIDNLPWWCLLKGSTECKLYTHSGTQIATGYDRIVVGDYGAFIEIRPERMLLGNVMIQPGQEYRVLDEQYSRRCKYHWYTARDHSGVKLYYQQRPVSYADYLPGMWYVSVYEVLPFVEGE